MANEVSVPVLEDVAQLILGAKRYGKWIEYPFADGVAFYVVHATTLERENIRRVSNMRVTMDGIDLAEVDTIRFHEGLIRFSVKDWKGITHEVIQQIIGGGYETNAELTASVPFNVNAVVAMANVQPIFSDWIVAAIVGEAHDITDYKLEKKT